MSNPRNEGSQRGDHQPTGSGWASRRSGCQASRRVAEDAWWSFGHSQAGSISSSTAPPAWGSCRLASARPGCDVPVSPGLDQREVADLAVAQAVVDEGEELAGHRGPGDVDAAPLGDAVVVDLELGPAVYMGDGLDGRPAQELRSLLGHLAPPSLAVRLAVLGSESRPRAQRLGTREATDVADLDHEDGAQHPTHAGQGLDGLIAAVVAQSLVDAALEHGDLAIDDRHQVAQRLDARAVGGGQLEGD